ncbi:hypothetical protein BS78_03G011700 [Paspalum vaginatum]|nr:hypothetical protein BS78_03G011700 [Paspalum vaginatum]
METASNWRSLFSSSFILVLPSLIISLVLVYCCCKFAHATDTLLPGQFLTANQSLVSKNGAFKLAFDCSKSHQDYDYCGLGIWFANSSSCDFDYFPAWQPYLTPGVSSYNLSVSEEGWLQIMVDGHLYWLSSNMGSTSISAVAVLLDSGNLVIRDQVNSSMVSWQSFDDPINVVLSGGYLGFISIVETSPYVSLSGFFYSGGTALLNYTLYLDSTRRRGFVIRQYPDGSMFAGTFPGWMNIHEDGDYGLTFNDPHTYIHFTRFGFVRFAKQGECGSILWSAPESLCDFDTFCGPYGICSWSGTCTCPVGFVDPPSSEGWYHAGCSRNEPLSCENNVTHAEETFYPIDGIHRYPDNALTLVVTNMTQCESSCLMDCTCVAFAYNTTCSLWFSELRNTVVRDSGSNGNTMYIRIATERKSGSRTTRVVLESTIGVVIALVVGGLILFLRCRRKRFGASTLGGDTGSLLVFSSVHIKNSTKSFSEKLGEGGFGCVSEGTLPDRTIVAVKKLKGLSQGEKQFRAEVQTIGLIQHMNIVRLLGFCAEDCVRFLVYEYMANGSLSRHLFSKSSCKLGWEVRYSIALGLARGLAYLHEECKDCIVHCDIKPDNVLLVEQFCPKIADFGMATLLGRDFSRVLTTMRGTIGYLAPEWIWGVPITCKADVYSYGMVLLEIISGRRNSEKIKEGGFTYFPIYAAVKVNEGDDVMCLLDSSLEGNADAEQLTRACRVACWCIQDAEDHRPMMGQVVRMLEGIVDVEVPPVPRSLQSYVGMEGPTSADFCISEVSC